MSEETSPTNASYCPDDDDVFDVLSTTPKDAFLATMTFAASDSALAARCDCDECGVDSSLPESIRVAVREHKRIKRGTGLIKRTQVRVLVHRQGDVAVWQLTMPSKAEPLLEFGNPSVHRLVWAQRLLRGSIVKSIGSGIIGSRNEELGRIILDWVEGDVYLVTSNEGKAVGWYVEAATSHDAEATNTGPVVLYVAKVPGELLDKQESSPLDTTRNEESNKRRRTMDSIQLICARAVFARENSHRAGDSQLTACKIETTDAALFRCMVSSLL